MLCDHCCRGKAMDITYCECVFVDLSIQRAMRMCRIALSSVACLAVQYFWGYLINGRIFGKKIIERKMVFFIFSANFRKKISKKELLNVKFFFDFLHKFSKKIFEKKNYWTQNFCFDFLHEFFLKHFSLQEHLSDILSKTCIGLQVKCPFFVKF